MSSQKERFGVKKRVQRGFRRGAKKGQKMTKNGDKWGVDRVLVQKIKNWTTRENKNFQKNPKIGDLLAKSEILTNFFQFFNGKSTRDIREKFFGIFLIYECPD